MKLLLFILYTGLVCHQASYGKVETRCEDGDPNCSDVDYQDEDAAKEVLLKDNFIYDILPKSKISNERNHAQQEGKVLKDWYIEWYQFIPALRRVDPESDIQKLCISDRGVNSFVDCHESSSRHRACIGTENGTVRECKSYEAKEFLIPICKEMSSKKVVTCGELSTHLCYPSDENKTSIRPCRDPVRQICLSENGSFKRCVELSYIKKGKIGALNLKHTIEVAEEGTKRELLSPKVKTDESERPVPLCLLKKEKEKLRHCNNNTEKKACFDVTNGEIADCRSYLDTDKEVSVCIEESSRRIITCEKFNITYFCLSKDNKKKPIQTCQSKNRQICLDDEGLIQLCVKSSPTAKSSPATHNEENVIDDDRTWNDWWAEWVSDVPPTSEEKSSKTKKKICMQEENNEKFVDCEKRSSKSEVCVSAKLGEISYCSKFNETDLPLPICIEVSSSKVISCEDNGSAFLCFPKGDKSRPIRPCRTKERQLCLTKDGLLKRCLNTKLQKDSENRNSTSDNKHDFQNWEQWWDDWFTPTSEEDISPSEDTPKRLCMTKNKNISECLPNSSDTEACVGAMTGNIEECDRIGSQDFPVPICTESSTNKIITCRTHTLAFLCFPKNLNSSALKPCKSIERHVCLGISGKVERCPEPVLYFFSYRNQDLSEKDSQQLRDNPVWTYWWKEWVTSSSEDKNAKMVGNPLCISDAKKHIIMDCKEDVNETTACVSAKDGTISDCSNFKDFDLPVIICRENSSNNIITCSNNTSAFLCSMKKGKSVIIRPCRSSNLQLCLTNSGLLEKCSEISYFEESMVEKVLPVPAENIYAKERENSKIKSNEVKFLCKDGRSNQTLPCSKHFSHPFACVNTKNGEIDTCQKIGNNSDIGIPVCIQVKTAVLVTCGIYSQESMCHPGGKKMYPLKPCKTVSRNVCVTKEGSLRKCPKKSKKFKVDSEGNDEYNNLIRMEYRSFEFRQQNVSFLCKPDDSKNLTECTNDSTINFACYSSKNRIIHACESANAYDLSVPVCIQGSSKAVVTCGRFNRVNLCLSSGKKKSSYRPCNSNKFTTCFKNGSIQKCNIKRLSYRMYDIFSNAFIKILNRSKGYQYSEYQNSDKVYKFENNSMKSILENCTRLCKPDDGKDQIKSCEKDPYINFACLGVSAGAVDACDTFGPTELVMPVCVETTKKVVAYGKFFKTHLCFHESGDKIKIKTCSSPNQHICLSKKSILEKCHETELGMRSALLEENTPIEMNFYEHLNTVTTSKADKYHTGMYGMQEKLLSEDDEELFEDDFNKESEKLIRTKSIKKTGKKSKESKLKGKKFSDIKSEGKSENKRYVKREKGKSESEIRKFNFQGIINMNIKHIKQRKKRGINEESKGVEYEDQEMLEGEIGDTEKNTEQRREEVDRTKDNKLVKKYHKGSEKVEREFNNHRQDEEIKDEKMLKNNEGEAVKDREVEKKELRDDEYKIKHLEAIRKKEFRQIANTHKNSVHLCKHSNKSENLINCDKTSFLNFACIGARDGNIKMCHAFKENDIAFPVCFLVNSKNLVTCDISSNVQLCFTKERNDAALRPCKYINRYACLGDDGVPVECVKNVVRRQSPDSDDEKFYRLLCKNCTIENTFVVEGKPEGVERELETFTFPPQ